MSCVGQILCNFCCHLIFAPTSAKQDSILITSGWLDDYYATLIALEGRITFAAKGLEAGSNKMNRQLGLMSLNLKREMRDKTMNLDVMMVGKKMTWMRSPWGSI